MSILDKAQRERYLFDVTNKKHVDEYRYFLVNKRWKNGCPFDLVWPYLSIPDMIRDKIINHYLDI